MLNMAHPSDLNGEDGRMPRLLHPEGPTDALFNRVRGSWESKRSRSGRAVILVAAFLGSIVVIELRRLGLLPESVREIVPDVSHLAAIAWSLSVLLVFEIVELILALEKSVAGALGVQLEVYSLILLRNAFVQLSEFGEPLVVAGHWNAVFAMGADAAGAILLFLITNWYRRMQRHSRITPDQTSQDRFVSIKKVISLLLLGVLVALIAYDIWSATGGEGHIITFDAFFTTLVFADVLLAFVSLGFSQTHPVVFRNFGFAFVAVLLRLALASEEFFRPAMGVAAGLVAVGVTFAYNDSLKPIALSRARSGGGEESPDVQGSASEQDR